MAPNIRHHPIACEQCGTIFKPRTVNQKLCSTACRTLWIRKVNPMLSCKQCGNEFSVASVFEATRKPRIYCSRQCAIIASRKPPTSENIAAKFWKNVDVRGPDDCWPWKLAPQTNGYGRVQIQKFRRSAHRVSYELHFGEIPQLEGTLGGCILHKCDNRPCVNPKHLFVGTQADNIHDAMTKGRNVNPPIYKKKPHVFYKKK